MKRAKYIIASLSILVLLAANSASAAWAYEQTFNALSTADLNGQDSWSGDTDYDVVTSPVYEGAKAVQGIDANGVIVRDFTGVSSGTVYWAQRCSDTLATGGDGNMDWMVSSTNIGFRFSCSDSGHIRVTNGAGTTNVFSFTPLTYYLFEVTFASNSYTFRYNSTGTSDGWSASNGPYSFGTNGSIVRARINTGGTVTIGIDYISPTNPIASAPSFNPYYFFDF